MYDARIGRKGGRSWCPGRGGEKYKCHELGCSEESCEIWRGCEERSAGLEERTWRGCEEGSEERRRTERVGMGMMTMRCEEEKWKGKGGDREILCW